MKIKVVHKDFYRTCGEGCCTEYGTDSVFTYLEQDFKYTGWDSDFNTLEFIKEVLHIEFEEEFISEND